MTGGPENRPLEARQQDELRHSLSAAGNADPGAFATSALYFIRKMGTMATGAYPIRFNTKPTLGIASLAMTDYKNPARQVVPQKSTQ